MRIIMCELYFQAKEGNYNLMEGGLYCIEL